jgi:hypothetical protein
MKRLLIPLLFLACNSHAAGIQKWTDENGQVHYGDSPPTQVKPEVVRISRPPSNPGKSLPRFSTENKAQQDKKQADAPADQAKAPPPEPSKEQAAEFCAQAKKDLATFNRSKRIRIKSADGSSRIMTSEEIAERRKQTQSDIDQYCN